MRRGRPSGFSSARRRCSRIAPARRSAATTARRRPGRRDGSKLTATQLAVAPSGAGNLPYQLVKANPASGSGALVGVTYIQRVALKGGVAPAAECNTGKRGQRETVVYQADYLFWKAL